MNASNNNSHRQTAMACAAIGLLLLFHAVNNYWLILHSSFILRCDQGGYYYFLRKFLYMFGQSKSNAIEFLLFLPKPPLFLVTAGSFLAVGQTYVAACMTNIAYLAILLFAVYGAGKRLYNHEVGLLAAFLVSMFPGVFALSRDLYIETALSAMVAATFYLFTVNRFDSTLFSAVTGVVIGLGMLTKQPYIVFLAPMLVYVFMQRENIRSPRRMINLAIMIAVAYAVASYWYRALSGAMSLSNYTHYAVMCANEAKGLLFYVKGMFFRQLYPVYFALFAGSYIYALKKKRYFLPLTVLALLIAFSLANNQEDRFIVPLFPFAALMISAWLLSVQARYKKLLVLCVAGFSVLQFSIICYNKPFNIQDVRWVGEYFKTHAEMYEKYDNSGLYAAKRESGVDALRQEMKRILSNVNTLTAKNRLSFVFITKDYHISTEMALLALEMKKELKLSQPISDGDALFISDKDMLRMSRRTILESDVVLFDNDPFEWRNEKMLKAAFREMNLEYQYLDRFAFPEDGHTYTLFVKKAILKDR